MDELEMSPRPEEHLLRYVGDRLRVVLAVPQDKRDGLRAFLRTNVTRGAVARREVIAMAGLRAEDALTFAGASWRDLPLQRCSEGFAIDLPLLEVGHFRAKAYCTDASGRQYWPSGGDLGISVHPDRFRTANTIYCAFPRAFLAGTVAPSRITESAIAELDHLGYTVIPPSGTLRGLTRALGHIFDGLGCRILHLLPVSPVPTTFARMGRYGSPYAQLDLTGIDPALVEFDKRRTGVEQFVELADAVHLRCGSVILDVVLNHTGWASRLFEEHPEWFKRAQDGTFHSPGAWGTVWADLVELDQAKSPLWEELAESLLVWCRRGVDGFRCDAGYMIPLPAWQYIVARVRNEFPDCLFLLEGLGGAWSATEDLVTVGGMQWAYSELFQCYSPEHVADYLDHANRKSGSVGILVHYSETHDNTRLALKGVRYASMRNHLSALSSHAGAFGFTAGVEWLCAQKVDVHEAHPLGFGSSPNLIEPLARLNRLLAQHPAFFDGASVERMSDRTQSVLVLKRVSADGLDHVVVLINLDAEQPRSARLSRALWEGLGTHPVDLLADTLPGTEALDGGEIEVVVGPGESICFAPHAEPRGPSGERYRRLRAQAAWGYTQLAAALPQECIGAAGYAPFARFIEESPEAFLTAVSHVTPEAAAGGLLEALAEAGTRAAYQPVVVLRPEHTSRINLVPPDHWLLLRDTFPFSAAYTDGATKVTLLSLAMGDEHVACIPPRAGTEERDVVILLDRFVEAGQAIPIPLRFLANVPVVARSARDGTVLLTNGRGGMSRVHADFGRVRSKYDAFLAANLHPEVPEDRWVLVKRLRACVNADGFITALDMHNLVQVEPGSPGVWTFAANAGDGRRVGIRISLAFVPGRNTLLCRFERVSTHSIDLPFDRGVRLTLRMDLEDRNFHGETHHHPELAAHFERAMSHFPDGSGFVFAPAAGRRLEVRLDAGAFHRESEWSYGIAHPFDAERGMHGSGDAFSPGWIELPLDHGIPVTMSIDAEGAFSCSAEDARNLVPAQLEGKDAFGLEAALRNAARAFVARRGEGRTVIAGYPWFLDWGRDTFVAARGLIAAGYHEDVEHMLLTYAALERNGTLPNFLAGEGEGSRESSDAPLWFALACAELARHRQDGLYALHAADGRTLLQVLVSIAESFLAGTPTGIAIDPESCLVFSPSHFTWMDTNYPAGTPREGYPIELAVLFAELLRQLARLGVSRSGEPYAVLAQRVVASLALFYRADLGFFADTLHCAAGTPASAAVADDHLRPNQLLAISLGLITDDRARSTLRAVARHLLVPGALRSLAPIGVRYPLPIVGSREQLLNDPLHPYFGSYTGDEDTRRKPAYHNGTAWGFWLPSYAEALLRTYPKDAFARTAARAVLGSCVRALGEGCLGQLPEVMDGDAPHHERGCDAQAWSVTEHLRVWLMLQR
jgi:predicted glycogen debranching enzyme